MPASTALRPMKKILGLIFNRWTMAILGLLAISLLIWYVGPSIKLDLPLLGLAEYRPLESEKVRGALIALIVLFYIGKLVWRLVKAKTANARLFDGMLKQTPVQPRPDAPGIEEVAVLGKRFEDAVGLLKKDRLGGKDKKSGVAILFGRQYVYELPWYMFIGAPGSGKTTALINSGLKFPLKDRLGDAAIRGVGGTRNCDWWFTNEAVLLDTAGRYTTQESDQAADRAGWSGFLQLLKKFRPRRPINGVLLTVSVADLLQQSAAEREVHANTLRKRLQELHEQLGIRFPLYVLVTKTDLLAGFMDFFSNYGSEERAQVWGATFPFGEKASDSPPPNFAQEFAALEQRLNDRLIDRLQEERDPQRRALLYTFPQQFASLKVVLDEFLDKVFFPSRFEEKPLLRGVYFTSGTQEGNPIDRIMGTLGRAFRLEPRLLAPQRPSGKSFFITRLLNDVIFPEAGIAGTNLKWERSRSLLQWSGLAAALIITLGCVAAWSMSYSRNKAYVTEVRNKLTGIGKQVETLSVTGNSDVVNLLPVLQSVQELAYTPAVSGKSAPVSMGFGLYQGEKLTAAARDTYQRLLQDTFLPRLALRIEQLLRNNVNRPEALYETLKAYIMLNDPEHFDRSALKSFISADWDENLPREVTTEQRTALQTHLNTLFERGPPASPIVPNARLVEATRAAIARTPIERRVYNRLRREGVGSQFPEFTIAQIVGPNAGIVCKRASGKPLTNGVPGLFSYKGYYDAFFKVADETSKQLADEEGWVLGLDEKQRVRGAGDKSRDRLFNAVRRLYLEDYARTWEDFVNDIRLEMGLERRQVIQAASILSAPDSPLPTLLKAIVTEVTLVKKADVDKTLLDKAQEKLQSNTDRLRNLLGGDKPRSTTDLATTPERIVDDRFDRLRRLVTPAAPGQPAPIDAQIALLQELAQALLTADAAIKANNPPPPSPAFPGHRRRTARRDSLG